MSEDTEQDLSPEAKLDSLMARKMEIEADLSDPIALAERMFQLWWNCADFHLYIISPHIESIAPAIVHEPESISTDEKEFVYSIHDTGDKLSTSKGEEMFSAGKSMCKLYFTIEKMIALLVERLKSGGIEASQEVQIAFGGHLMAERKAFESVINLSYNVVVTNFDPGEWGERYLHNVKRISDKGYGYPTEAPRYPYKQSYKSTGTGIKRTS